MRKTMGLALVAAMLATPTLAADLVIDVPDYYDVSTKYFWESNFYDLTLNKLLFSVQTQSFDPSSVSDLAHEYGQKIIQSMTKTGVLQKQEKIAKQDKSTKTM